MLPHKNSLSLQELVSLRLISAKPGIEYPMQFCFHSQSCQFMHLTNYSVNKYSDSFVKTSNADQGSKRYDALILKKLILYADFEIKI